MLSPGLQVEGEAERRQIQRNLGKGSELRVVGALGALGAAWRR